MFWVLKFSLRPWSYLNNEGIVYDRMDMITPAVRTPSVIGTMASFSFIRRPDATKAPVQPPVPGSGTATKTNKPHFLCFSTEALLAFAFFSKCSTNFLIRVFFRKKKILSMNKSMNGIGKRFPSTQIGKAYSRFTFNRLAAISPPRSSKIGISDTMKMMISAGITLVRECVIDATIDSAKRKTS